ncbi:uncharacterized protein LOC132623871 [Lycium barbarum]|uniref:uncharacterized protein LOC132623871 n=1 Tax=Lycium barbarum TaxID=112863 RepID=UPI00293F11A5|nr:uncharacterized protein LOC132623871 [Lycium barbarum]
MNSRSFESNRDFNLIESGEFEFFPWGKVVFTSLIDSVRDKLKKVNKFYRFGGLPLALQIWVDECFSNVREEIVIRVSNRVPRILNWQVIKEKPGFSKLCKAMFNNKIIYSNISATKEELGILPLLENEEYDLRDCRPFHDSPEFHVGDDDFEIPPSKKMKQQHQQAATKMISSISDI